MYATDRRQIGSLMPPPIRAGHNNIDNCRAQKSAVELNEEVPAVAMWSAF